MHAIRRLLAIAFIGLATPLTADEGMWLPQQVPALADRLAALGFEGDPRAFADLTGQPMGAIVSLGGCSASFVSPEGLVVTNHHCVTGALQYNATPERNLLVDGYHARTREEELPAGPRRRLDWLVVASPKNEQIAALTRTLERFPPGDVLWAGAGEDSSAVRSLRDFFSEQGITTIAAERGQTVDLGDGAVLRVVAVEERGAVLLLEWGSFRALLPLGMDEGMLEDLLDNPELGPVTALLLADGGASGLNPQQWIEKLRPQVALLSAG